MEKKPRFSLLMILCCVIPMALVILFLTGGIGSLGGGNFSFPSGAWLMLIICPLMHIGMMFFMKDSCHGDNKKQKKENVDNDKTVYQEGS